MWQIACKDAENSAELCFKQLIGECRTSHPGAKLSLMLRTQLERFPIDIRHEIAVTLDAGASPLFIACKKGKLEIVEYLITVCHADIEQRGCYEVPDERSTHVVSPLWCASVAGRLSVVKCLLQYGANINAVSDTGSTPVRSACFMSNLDIVKLLVEMGADINKPNYNGGTCLINSVQSVTLCEFLLDHGANVNASDIQGKTALHYAIQEHRLETAQLLIQRGADCFAKSRYGDDALQTACMKAAVNVFVYLTEDSSMGYTPEQLANGYELLGSSCLIDHNDVHGLILYWKKALAIRSAVPGLLPKQPVMKPFAAYLYQREFATLDELENVVVDIDLLRIQCLLVTERILGAYHKDHICRLMLRGANYIDAFLFQRCIDLWTHALQIKVRRDSIICTDTCISAQSLVRIMLHYNQQYDAEMENENKEFQNAFEVFIILTENIIDFRKVITIKPVNKRQVDNFDKILNAIAHLIYLMVNTAQTPYDIHVAKEVTTKLLHANPTTINTEDTLLHLCVSKLNVVSTGYILDLQSILIFPHVDTIKFLLDCGAPVNAQNERNHTPLYSAASFVNYNGMIVKLLLDNGAHIDQPDSLGETPLSKITSANDRLSSDIRILDYLSLQCLCANVICKYQIEYKNQVPKNVEEFVEKHQTRAAKFH